MYSFIFMYIFWDTNFLLHKKFQFYVFWTHSSFKFMYFFWISRPDWRETLANAKQKHSKPFFEMFVLVLVSILKILISSLFEPESCDFKLACEPRWAPRGPFLAYGWGGVHRTISQGARIVYN